MQGDGAAHEATLGDSSSASGAASRAGSEVESGAESEVEVESEVEFGAGSASGAGSTSRAASASVPAQHHGEADTVAGPAAKLTALLTRVQAGDQGAFTELYDELGSRVMGLVQHILRDHAQSEEVTQEIFLEIWQQARSFEQERGSAMAWIMTRAHRRAVDRVRSSESTRTRDERIGIRDTPVDYDPVSEQAELHVEHARVQRALENISPPQREAVVLAYYAGYSQTEIAAHLSVPLGTIKTRIRDGMTRLRQELGVTS
ncbi:ECF RNA polymerase sigma factor SigK [Lysinibacter cavernae]|uniref:RNA polymerase sigma-70 factor (ECF subfamily) n=1 Tax=Lysinibacter cavernae TaxID=1640652 RepID=A0A7X5TSY3_9MICO|nr:RNA polymerase sigma-70 factor (ECF subfamily) [Lysinibacter cavernae]